MGNTEQGKKKKSWVEATAVIAGVVTVIPAVLWLGRKIGQKIQIEGEKRQAENKRKQLREHLDRHASDPDRPEREG